VSAAAPWSVKGIDPKAREVAKDLARRSGMTLGEWLNTMIMDDDDDGVQPLPRRPHASDIFERRGRSRRLDDAYDAGPGLVQEPSSDETLHRVAASVDAIAARLEAAERRSTLAIQGVDQAVAGLVRRLDGQETVGKTYGRRIDDIADELREGHRRLRRFEQDTAPQATEMVGKVEQGVNALASRLYDIEERQRTGVNELRARLEGVEKADVAGKLDTALSALTSRLYDMEERQRVGNETLRQRMEMAEKAAGPGAGTDLLAQVGARLDGAQSATTEALKSLERSFAGLDQRLRAAEGRVEPEGSREAARFEKLAETLTRQVDNNRAEMMRKFEVAEHQGRLERIERAVVAIGDQAKASEQRGVQAVEAMGREVLRIAQNLNGRMQSVETGAADRLEGIKQSLTASLNEKLDRDMGRYAQAIDHRITRADDQHAIALEKLGGEITRISDRLADRIAQSERKSAQALDDIGQRLNESSERIEQRYDRASGELVERMRLSEERTGRLLAEAREVVERREARLARQTPLSRHDADAHLDLPRMPVVEKNQPDWRAAAFPGEDFGAAAQDVWSVDTLDGDLAPAPFPAPLTSGAAAQTTPFEASTFGAATPEPAETIATPPTSSPAFLAEAMPSARSAPPPFDVAGVPFGSTAQSFQASQAAVTPDAPSEPPPLAFGGFGGADVGDALEATAAAVAPFDGEPDDYAAETDFVDARQRAPGGVGSTRNALNAARAAMTATAAEPAPRAGFGLKRGGKSRLQERLDKQAARDGSTVRKALLASVTSVAVISGVYVTGRINGGEGFLVPELDQMGRTMGQALGLGSPQGAGPVQGVDDMGAPALAAVALTPTDAVSTEVSEAQRLFDQAVEQLDGGQSGAVETLTRAANLGNAMAQLKLASLYEAGESGVTRNLTEARTWARRAAEGGDPKGMHAFAMYLFEGAGGARNRPEALTWLVKAAELGLVDSQYNAARIYEKGDEGIAPNPTEAFKWYLIAARTGDQQAQASVERLTPEVSAAGRRTARADAAAFQVAPLA